MFNMSYRVHKETYGLLRCKEIVSHFLITSCLYVEETWHMLTEDLTNADVLVEWRNNHLVKMWGF